MTGESAIWSLALGSTQTVDRRPNKRANPPPEEQSCLPDVFAEFGLSLADFDVEDGGGKSFLTVSGLCK